MSWLDKVVNLAVQSAGSLIGTRPTMNFSGAGVTVTDDSTNNRVNVAISGAAASDATTTTKGIVQLAGDIAGTATSVQVAKVNGVSVSGTPTNGQVITASNGTTAAWATPAAPSDASTSAKGIVQLAGDIAGTSTSVTVAKVNGVTVTGTPSASQVLTASSGTAAAWTALPVASTSAQGIVQLAGDIAGTASSVTVAKINGVSVTGTPTNGQVITASSGTAASWQTPSGGGGGGYGPYTTLTAPPSVSSLVWQNQSSATATNSTNGFVISCTGVAAVNSRKMLTQALGSSAAFTFDFGFLPTLTVGDQYPLIGFGVYDSTSQFALIFEFYWRSLGGGAGGAFFFDVVRRQLASDAGSSVVVSETMAMPNPTYFSLWSSAMFLRVTWTGATYSLFGGSDGENWAPIPGTAGTLPVNVTTPSHVGIVLDAISASASCKSSARVFHWKIT